MGTTSIRLPRHIDSALDKLAKERGTTRSELIREALAQFIAECAAGSADRVALLGQLVDYPGSGRGDLARNGEAYLRESFGARCRARSR